jgi:hypothetical protein
VKVTKTKVSRPESAGRVEAAVARGARVGVLMIYDQRRTPKAQVAGPGALARAAAILEPLYGPALVLPGGVGWNLNRSEFGRAQALLVATAGPTAAKPGRRRASILTPEDRSPPSALWLDGRKVRFVGFGKVFRLTRQQAATRPIPGTPPAGAKVRLAYYV